MNRYEYPDFKRPRFQAIAKGQKWRERDRPYIMTIAGRHDDVGYWMVTLQSRESKDANGVFTQVDTRMTEEDIRLYYEPL